MIINIYLLTATVSESQLRKIELYPIGIQAFCDLLTALAFTHGSVQVILTQRTDFSSREFVLSDGFWNSLRAMYFLNPSIPSTNNYWRDLLTFGRSKLNYYSTSLCMIVIGLERYILICQPLAAKTFLTKRNRIKLAITLTASIIIVSLHHFFCAWGRFATRLTGFRFEICLFSRKELYSIIFISSFYIIPSLVILMLYIPVGIRLRKTKFHRSRNRDLTNAFILSYIFWVILWLPKTTTTILKTFTPNWNQQGGDAISINQTIAEGLAYIDWEFFLLQTLVNPLIFIFVSRGFQKPIRKLFGKLLPKLRQ